MMQQHSMPGRCRSYGVTLIEIMICVLVGSILIYAASRLLSGGLKTSAKGTAHLNLVQATTILMSQIEDDLHRASRIIVPGQNAKDSTAQIEAWETDSTGKPILTTVSYLPGPGGKGFTRRRSVGGGSEEHVFCRGMLTTASFTSVLTNDTARIGMVATLYSRVPAPGNEDFLLTRFIYCSDHASNSLPIGWQRRL